MAATASLFLSYFMPNFVNLKLNIVLSCKNMYSHLKIVDSIFFLSNGMHVYVIIIFNKQ